MTYTVSSLIEKLRTKPNGRQFASLFDDGDISDYISVADAELALCKIIAMETLDPNLIDGVFQESSLCRPRVWNRDRYSDNIIQQAIAATKASNGIALLLVIYRASANRRSPSCISSHADNLRSSGMNRA